ncbi:hypothetical protein Slin15195_G007090 [Septoria linicola]|uniref:Uncharacterized protein n=1 Tax=Septoria linicola TaxID=215465 RepID=A0A9Q9AE09_9PEZI|nr:hypothetical protein Slin14017_G007100 [Septoria linicola]USW47390.1 hypothetical protein Slin15195_G007090 [Septoria linicola]
MINTSARPPRTDPLALEEAQLEESSIDQSTAPFVAELTSLLGLWQIVLPFGLISQHVPPAQNVHQYSMRFTDFADIIAEPPAFVVVLFKVTLMPREAEQGLRPILLSDEHRKKTKKAATARAEGIHIISTWRWDRAAKMATFWLRSDVFKSLIADGSWGISIWRTDVWARKAGPEPLEEVVDAGQFCV